MAAPGLGRRRRHQERVRRLARRAGVSRRVVPAPVLVPPRRLRRRSPGPGYLRPDAARQPAHRHGLREVLHLAGRAESGLPGGHAARLRRRRRVPGRPRSPGSRRAPAGRGRLRPQPPRRHGAATAPHRGLTAGQDLFSTVDRLGLNLAVCLPTGGFVTATPGSASSAGSRHLNGIAEIRTFFRTNQQPIYFVGPTAFNLLGIDRWVRNFQYIAYYDSWDGQHPRVFTPENRPYVEFESSEQINNYLLRDPEVQDYLSRRGGTPLVAMVFFDEETEEICREQGYSLILPPDTRRRLDSKIVTTQLGNEAGAPSVPNVLGHADSYAALTALAVGAGLGDDLVVQTPYGDSGKTTFFIKSESDWDDYAADIDGQQLK